MLELALTFRKKRPDVVHLNNSKAGVVGALAARLSNAFSKHRIKVVFTAHGWVFNPKNDLSPFRRRFYIFLHRIAARGQDTIICASRYDRELALKHGIAPPEKLVVIYNGIDPQTINFLDRASARRAILDKLKAKSYQLKASDTWVGSVGRLTKEKAYDDFIAAASQIDDPEVSFFIIGAGPLRENLQEKISELKLQERFFIIPGISPAAPFLKAFDIFVLSSIKEGLPYSLLEAVSAGVPTVTTGVGGMPEAIAGNGLIVPPKNPAMLREAIQKLIKDQKTRGKLPDEAQRGPQKEFTLKVMLEKTAAVYRALLVSRF